MTYWHVFFLLSPHAAADSFNHKAFFAKVGLAAKSAADIKKAFAIIDQDNSGFIERKSWSENHNNSLTLDSVAGWITGLCSSCRLFLQNFKASGRALTDKETKAFLAAGDSDGDGMIGADGTWKMPFWHHFTSQMRSRKEVRKGSLTLEWGKVRKLGYKP